MRTSLGDAPSHSRWAAAVRALWPGGGLLLTLALCLFALWPLLRPGLPNGTDVLYHVYRAAEMDRAWAHGVLLPRWAEGLYYGYGSPLFHYYAGETYYLTSLFARVFGTDAVNSLRLLTALSALLSGAGMYLFVRARAQRPLAGVIAGVVYVYSPYLLYTEPYARGDYPELLAFALFPLLMWRFACLLDAPRPRNVLWAALAVLALILAHNLMALVLFGVLVGWLLWGMLRARSLNRRGEGLPPTSERLASRLERFFSSPAIALLTAGLGVGLAAYFWLPVIAEAGEVQLANLTAVALLDFRNFFTPLSHLLAAAPRADAGAINGLLHLLNLGLAQWLLALSGLLGVGLIVWRRWRAQQKAPAILRDALFFALLALAMIFLMLPASAFIWEAIPPLAYLQFPWRFLGPVAFCLALLAAMNAAWIEKLPARWGGVAAAGVVALPVALALPMLYVPEWVHPTVDTSIAAYHQSEVNKLQSGTTFTNEYLPKTVEVLADPTSWLLAAYAESYAPGGDGLVDKANRAFLPEGVTITPLEHGPQHDVWRVEAAAAFKMEALTHAFAGWTAEVDGARVPVVPSPTHGFISFEVPAGAHTVRVYLGSTPARDLGRLITLLAALGVAGLMAVLRRRESSVRAEMRPVPLAGHLRAGLAAGWLLSAALALIFMRPGLAWIESPPGEALIAEHRLKYDLYSEDGAAHLQFLGYDLNALAFRPGDRLELVVYWYAPQPVPYRYQSFVHVSTGGPPNAQADKQNPAGRPTVNWTAQGYIRDDYVIMLPADIPAGEYNLLVGLYTCETLPAGECGNGDRLRVEDKQGNLLGDAIPLGTIIVR